jgi:magnesium transporter
MRPQRQKHILSHMGLVTAKSGGGLELREWSSLIGIVTAIIGNILISFALNVQRYAHIRIQQEYDEGRSWKRGKRRAGGLRDYGTQQQILIAEEGPHINSTATSGENGSPTDNRQDNGHIGYDGNESEPMKRSFLSDHTLASSERSSENSDRKSYLGSPYWWLGIVLMTVGETGNFLAYGFAPASIVSPLGVVALISNCVIAPFMLKEKFRQRDLWGVLVAVAGAVTVVLSAKTSEEKLGPDDIWDAITRWEFETYLGITAALIICLMWASGKYGDRSILIDLGLVGLFGMILVYTSLSRFADKGLRGVHGPLNQGRRLAPLRYPMADAHLPNHVSVACDPYRHGWDANPLSQPGTSTIRFYASNPHAIRSLHPFSHHWKHRPIPRF